MLSTDCFSTFRSGYRWVALKILRSEHSSVQNPELKALRSLRVERRSYLQKLWDMLRRTCCIPPPKSRRQKTSIVQYLDHFWIQSANGSHLCLVLELLGPSLLKYMEHTIDQGEDPPIVPYTVTAVGLCRSCVVSLKELHDSGYAHGGLSPFLIHLNFRTLRLALTIFWSGRYLSG